MGADYEGQEKAIKEVRALSGEAKQLLAHHFRNPLTVIMSEAQMRELRAIEESAKHIVEDLERFGL